MTVNSSALTMTITKQYLTPLVVNNQDKQSLKHCHGLQSSSTQSEECVYMNILDLLSIKGHVHERVT